MQVKHLKKRANFLLMRNKGNVVFTAAFTLQYAKTELIIKDSDCNDNLHIGFTVTKKVGNAVQRNRVKRRLREAFRLYFAPNCPTGHCYVMIGTPKMLMMSFEELVKNIGFAIRKMQQAMNAQEILIRENHTKQMVATHG